MEHLISERVGHAHIPINLRVKSSCPNANFVYALNASVKIFFTCCFEAAALGGSWSPGFCTRPNADGENVTASNKNWDETFISGELEEANLRRGYVRGHAGRYLYKSDASAAIHSFQ